MEDPLHPVKEPSKRYIYEACAVFQKIDKGTYQTRKNKLSRKLLYSRKDVLSMVAGGKKVAIVNKEDMDKVLLANFNL